MTALRRFRGFVRDALNSERDPVVRLSRADLEQRADRIAREWLHVSRADAFAMLDRGELTGNLAEPELRAVRDMLDGTSR